MQNRKFAVLVLLGLMLIQAGCARQVGKTNDIREETGVVENTEHVEVLGSSNVEQAKPRINIFIENSASMDGFINQESKYKRDLTRLTILLQDKYGKDNLRLFFINDGLFEKKGDDPVDVIDNMLVHTHFKHDGKRSNTKLSDLVDKVLDSTNQNSISLFISDCIFSIKANDGTTKDLLDNCNNMTMKSFVNKLSVTKDISTLIVRMESNFDGGYWDYKHPTGSASQRLNGCVRPYYICIIGADDNIRKFLHDIDLVDELSGFSHQYYLSSKDLSNTFFAVCKPNNKGAFIVEDDSIISLRNTGETRFAVAINLDDFPMTEEEKTNKNYYFVDGNYHIDTIIPIDKNMSFSPNENKRILDNGTHLLFVSSEGSFSDFSIKVKRLVPKWVADFSSDDDSKISNDNSTELKKTFGISFFINGVTDAYRAKSREKGYYFTMNFKIKK